MKTGREKPSPAPGSNAMLVHEDRLFPADPSSRAIARRLYASVQDLPIVSPHGHTDPRWYAENEAFPDPATLFVVPDHYIFRMLYSQGIRLEDLGIAPKDGGAVEPIRARSGVCSPRIIISFAARRHAPGSTTPSRRCSASTSGCRPRMRTPITTGSTRPCARRSSGRARSSSASASRRSPRPRARSIP